MKKIILACETIKDELMEAMANVREETPVIWIESGLHDKPCELGRTIQQEIEALAPGIFDMVVLGFGFCGNAVTGLVSDDFKLVIPRAEDCISLLLNGAGNTAAEEDFSAGRTYYLTEGWLQNERNIWREYQHAVRRFGLKRADGMFHRMLKHYDNLALIDTGAFSIDEVYRRVQAIAERLNFEPRLIEGSTRYFRRLVTGPYTAEDFVVLPPGEEVTYKRLREKKPLPGSGQTGEYR